MTIRAQTGPGARRQAIGYEFTRTWCLACAPEGIVDCYEPMLEGDNYGICDDCGKELKPCDHEWSGWHNWYAGGEFRICDKPGCGETEHR